MGKTQPSKRELSEQKKKEEEHAAAQVIVNFIIFIYLNILVDNIFSIMYLSTIRLLKSL